MCVCVYYYISLKGSLSDYIIISKNISKDIFHALFFISFIAPFCVKLTFLLFIKTFTILINNNCNQFARITINFKAERLVEMQISALRITYLESPLKSIAL